MDAFSRRFAMDAVIDLSGMLWLKRMERALDLNVTSPS